MPRTRRQNKILHDEINGCHGESERRIIAEFVRDGMEDGDDISPDDLAENMADASMALAWRLKGLKPVLATYRYADVSTAHIPKTDGDNLEEDAAWFDSRNERSHGNDTTPRLIVFSYDAGFFVDTATVAFEEEFKLLKSRYSKALLSLLRAAHEQGCLFLRLDVDAMRYDELPEYNW